MALVSHVLGDCPGCGQKDVFGGKYIYARARTGGLEGVISRRVRLLYYNRFAQ